MRRLLLGLALLVAACGDDEEPESDAPNVCSEGGGDVECVVDPFEYHTLPGEVHEGRFFRIIVDDMPCVMYSRGEGDARTISLSCDWSSR